VFQPAEQIKTPLLAGIYGPAGSGKSLTALKLMRAIRTNARAGSPSLRPTRRSYWSCWSRGKINRCQRTGNATSNA